MKRFAIIGICIFGILSVLSTAYIFYNSMQSGHLSNQRSETIAEQMAEMVVPEDQQNEEKIDEVQKQWNKTIRKVAHIVEFAALGFSLGGLTISLFFLIKRWFFGSALFLSLLVGVTDEYIQAFYKRTSSIKDIWRDLIGAAVGLILITLLFKIVFLIRKKKQKNQITFVERTSSSP